MADDVITAKSMALAARFDPQFAVPARPRLRRGLSIRRHPDRLVVEGTPTRHVLRGKAATELVPNILPLLDGQRDHLAIATELEVPQESIFAALSLLWTCGVVEDSCPAEVDTQWIPEHLADYLSRVGDSTEANPAWELAAQRLAQARLRLAGPAETVDLIRSELAGAFPDIGEATIGTLAPDALAPGTLVVLAGADAALAQHCWDNDIPLLRVSLTSTHAEIGPYADRATSPCLACQLATNADALDPGEAPADDAAGLGSRLVGAAMIAAQIVGLVSRATPVLLPVRWGRVDLRRLSLSQRSGVTRPGCPNCSAVHAEQPRAASIASRYDAAVALPPKSFVDLKAHQAHYQPANMALQRKHKTWPLAPRLALPRLDLAQLAPSGSGELGAGGGFSAAQAGLLLGLAAGWRQDDVTEQRPDRVFRWTASGGNIGSVVAYLVARDVDGLDPGIYGYLPSTHELALIEPAHEALPGPGPASVVLVADLGRVAYKYGAFALRVVLLDAGCAQATMLATAQGLALPARVAPRWEDEAVARALAIEPDAEPITAIIHFGGIE